MLQILLFNAERAWAYAMQLKQDATDHSDEARKINHALRRLTKAAQWANVLKKLSQEVADDVTQLGNFINFYLYLNIPYNLRIFIH